MRKFLLFLSIFVAFASISRAAEVTQKWTFDKGNPTSQISLGSFYTDESQYLPDGWFMMARKMNQSKPYYYISPDMGQDGLPALKGLSSSNNPSKDAIVLPVKAGKLSFNLKLNERTFQTKATIDLYNVTQSGDTWTFGSKIISKEFTESSEPAINRANFTLVSFDVAADGYIGFILQNNSYILDVRNVYEGTETTYTVSGTVVDDEGNPVGDAKVAVQGKSAQTAADGTFSVAEVGEGESTLTVSKEGYSATSQTVTVSGADLTGVNVVLNPIVSGVKGRLMDDNLDNLVAAATITIADGDGNVYGTAQTTASDPNYEITFKGAVPSSLKVTIESDYYSNSTITWNPVVGQIYQRNFVINRKKLNPVVALKDAAGNPVSGATVTLTAKDDASDTRTFSESSTKGSYAYTSLPYFYAHKALDKEYVVSVALSDYKPYTSEPVVFSGQNKNVEATLTAYAPTVFKGVVRSSLDNEPLAGVAVSLSLPDTPTAVATAEADPSGNYSISVEGALAGSYVLSFITDDFEDKTVDINSPERGETYVNDVVMQAVMVAFTARVQNAAGETVADAKLNFDGKDLEAVGGVFSAEVPAYGSYWKEYDVKITANGYETLDEKVIFNGAPVDKKFTLEETMQTFSAGVVNEAGDAVEGASVMFDGTPLTAENGVFTTKVGMLASADKEYTVVVRADGYESSTETVVFSGESIDRTFTLKEMLVTFTAVVNDTDGNPLEGAKVTISDGETTEELEYEGRGYYSVEYGVIEAGSKTYTVVVSKEGYVAPEPFSFSFNGESVSKTFLLEKESGISSIGADNDDTLRVYDLMGRRIEVENLSQLSSGLYIVNGVKTAIR